MISVLTVAAALAPLSADPAAVHTPALSASIRPTSITFVNPTPEPRLLLLDTAGNGPSGTLWIAPLDHHKARFPRGTLDELRLQVLVVDGAGWRASDSVDLGDALRSGAGIVDLLDLGARLRFLAHSPPGPRFLEPAEQLLPERAGLGGTQASTATTGSASRATHVPVVPPRERQPSNGPPKVGSKPLPPV